MPLAVGNCPVVDNLMAFDNHPHKAQRTAAYSVAAFVVAASAAVFPSQLFAYTVPDSCLCWVSGSLAASHVAAVARMVVGIEENCCCVGKGAVDVVGDWLDLEHTGFAQEENHYNPFAVDPEGQQ